VSDQSGPNTTGALAEGGILGEPTDFERRDLF